MSEIFQDEWKPVTLFFITLANSSGYFVIPKQSHYFYRNIYMSEQSKTLEFHFHKIFEKI